MQGELCFVSREQYEFFARHAHMPSCRRNKGGRAKRPPGSPAPVPKRVTARDSTINSGILLCPSLLLVRAIAERSKVKRDEARLSIDCLHKPPRKLRVGGYCLEPFGGSCESRKSVRWFVMLLRLKVTRVASMARAESWAFFSWESKKTI